ncbi:N-acylphosphatidylethanolamine synthase [Vitis vinifera]|uniref:Tafazzin family protein n=1 Tax=Vitis vinifera TaxID=29760 RepID=A0A438HA20_VITVI|nr:N-acylphosphatidylethanolamine synthase [Vitis vinifera]
MAASGKLVPVTWTLSLAVCLVNGCWLVPSKLCELSASAKSFLLSNEQLHTFPEGKVSQEDSPITRLKWGTASLIVRAPVTPIVLPIVHHGLEEVMPENFFVGRRPPFPLWNKKIKIVVGEPIEFDLPKLRQEAVSTSRNLSFPRVGWPSTSPCGLDEAAQRCLFTAISEQIWAVMERLRDSLKHS